MMHVLHSSRIFKMLGFHRELHFDQVKETDDAATVRTHTTGTITILATRNEMPVASRELFVLRKSGDGWRITNYMFNRTGPAH